MPRPPSDFPWLDNRDGVYYAFWYDAKLRRTQRLSLRTRDSEAAKRKFAAFLIEGGDLYNPAAADERLTWGQALDAYVREHCDVHRQVSVRGMVTNLKTFFGATPVTATDVPMCRAYADARREGKIYGRLRKGEPWAGGNGTIRRELSLLLEAANHAVLWKRLKKAELPELELPEAPPPRERWLNKAELALLYKAAAGDQDLVDFIDACYSTAARRNSIETITRFQINLETNRITLAKRGERKTNKRRPVIPIDPAYRHMWARRMKTVKGEKLFGGKDFYRKFTATVKHAGLGPEVVPHTLRHTRATHLLQAGKPIWAVAGLLGDTVTTVQQTYGHHCADHLADVLSDEAEAEKIVHSLLD